jgi:hypothetical protein
MSTKAQKQGKKRKKAHFFKKKNPSVPVAHDE